LIQAAEARLARLHCVMRLWWIKISILIVAVLGIGVLAGYRVNVSSSLPLGLYRALGDATAIRRGSIVVVCLPEAWSRFALKRRILGSGQCAGGSYGLGKFVVAVEGDVVTLSRDELIINGKGFDNFRTLDRDRAGRGVPHFPWGIYTLGPGEVWLYSPHRSAFDSRYFGPVKAARVKSVVLPVLAQPADSALFARRSIR
jgi:conjugative transfer signal peptidase TraF